MIIIQKTYFPLKSLLKYLGIVVCLTFSGNQLTAQPALMLSHSGECLSLFNPAATGCDTSLVTLTLIGRTMYPIYNVKKLDIGINGFVFRYKPKKIVSGIGLYQLNRYRFLCNSRYIYLESYSILGLQISKEFDLWKGKLSVGLNPEWCYTRFQDKYISEPDHNFIGSVSNYKLGGGIMYHNDHFYVGVSRQHVYDESVGWFLDDRVDYIQGGYKIHLKSSGFEFNPAILYNLNYSFYKSNQRIQVSLTIKYKNRYYVGIGSENRFPLNNFIKFGFNPSRKLTLGYTLNLFAGYYNDYYVSPKSNELLIRYSFK